MRLISTLLRVEERFCEAEAKIEPGNMFVRKDGRLARAAVAEMLAQTFAAGMAQGNASGETRGFLVALRDFHFHRDLHVGERVLLQVRLTDIVGSFHLLDAQAFSSGSLVAGGQLRVYVPQGDA